MYANGDGVAQDDVRAFEYFSRIANAHAEDSPSAPQAQIVANAFVALGRYYLSGIPNSKVKADPDRAREMFSYAASYFGNADAQYDLARLYLKTPDASREDFRYGARWLGLAAQKGQHEAQALLGQMLFNGDRLPRQAARGLMWLTLARDSAGTDETWIKESYNRAFAKASDDDRAMCAANAGAVGAGPPRVSCRRGAVGWAPDRVSNRVNTILHELQWWARLRSDTATATRGCASGRLDIQIDIDRHVVRGPLPGADMLVDASGGEPIGRLRRQQQMVDPDAPVLLPGAGLVVPKGVEAGLVGDRAQRIGQAEAERAWKFRGSAAGTRRRGPGLAILESGGAGMTLKSPARTKGSSA